MVALYRCMSYFLMFQSIVGVLGLVAANKRQILAICSDTVNEVTKSWPNCHASEHCEEFTCGMRHFGTLWKFRTHIDKCKMPLQVIVIVETTAGKLSYTSESCAQYLVPDNLKPNDFDIMQVILKMNQDKDNDTLALELILKGCRENACSEVQIIVLEVPISNDDCNFWEKLSTTIQTFLIILFIAIFVFISLLCVYCFHKCYNKRGKKHGCTTTPVHIDIKVEDTKL